MSGNDLRSDAAPCIQVPYREFASGVDTDEVVDAKLDIVERCGPRRLKNFLHPSLAKDVDFPRAELALAGSNR